MVLSSGEPDSRPRATHHELCHGNHSLHSEIRSGEASRSVMLLLQVDFRNVKKTTGSTKPTTHRGENLAAICSCGFLSTRMYRLRYPTCACARIVSKTPTDCECQATDWWEWSYLRRSESLPEGSHHLFEGSHLQGPSEWCHPRNLGERHILEGEGPPAI